MYSFEGQYKRKPIQALGGASKKEQKDVLLENARAERQKREDSRKQTQAAIKIQSYIRGSWARKNKREACRLQYDGNLGQLSSNRATQEQLVFLIRNLVYCYRTELDQQRLVSLCQICLKQKDMVASMVCEGRLPQWGSILAMCCGHLANIANEASQNITVPLRVVEIFTSSKTYIESGLDRSREVQFMTHLHGNLVERGYFKCMYALINGRVPDSIENSPTPPTPMAASVYELLVKPLAVVNYKHVTDNTKQTILEALCREVFCVEYSIQANNFIIPALVYGNSKFPFADMLHALLPNEKTQHVKDDDYKRMILTVPQTPWLLGVLLKLSEKYLGSVSQQDLLCYLEILQALIPCLPTPKDLGTLQQEDSDSEDDDAMCIEVDSKLTELKDDCITKIDAPSHIACIISTVQDNPDEATITAVCTLCHALMSDQKISVHKSGLLNSLAYNSQLVQYMWKCCTAVSSLSITKKRVPLLQQLSRGLEISRENLDQIVSLLATFCSLFSHSITTLHDSEFHGDEGGSHMPFKVSELVPMSLELRNACLGIIELAHPDTKPTLREDYRKAFQSVGVNLLDTLSKEQLEYKRKTWAHLFKVISHLVKQLHARDTRRPFCSFGHWLAPQVNIQADKPSQIFTSLEQFVRKPFGAKSILNTDRYAEEEEGPPLSTMEVKNLTILTELPFVLPFQERVKIFHKLIQREKTEHQDDRGGFMLGPAISVMIRRNYIYEDAFDKLSPENEPNMKLRMRVQLVNAAGLDEAGIDGGGIFREFLSVLLKTGFDPNRGFFKSTSDKLLYPNCQAHLLVDNYTKHFYFLGRMLGKALYENLMVELPFASFFLSKILSRHDNIDIDNLASLDPDLYKNLLFVRNYDGDVSELGLDFTVGNDALGEMEIEELKPGGRDIAVTKDNRIEYIHLMAHYRLNKQIRPHCYAFRQGLADVVNLEWLRMFDQHELQVLTSGAQVPVDLEDLKNHTNYSGGYTSDHPVIKAFWQTVAEFSDNQKRYLLKFVTSCSRPPLLGFKDLFPVFCIHCAGNEADRLPTASTCMNLLKLPEFKDAQTLKTKLLYAIESHAGFELS
ncbi:unnamed protein product [Owenia fusiformis]|uniref:Ubiquitin-protein ligase E3C n=1 Tax=Owenia fusiformis TaxID=6347 RepID=A0A8J1YAG0_OWEFU|nr:unnamed protein product [Owenia fusiformis]